MSIQAGDKVAYSRAFLRSTGMFTGDIPFARGTVTALEPLRHGGTVLARVQWDRSGILERVNVANLVRVDRIPFEPA